MCINCELALGLGTLPLALAPGLVVVAVRRTKHFMRDRKRRTTGGDRGIGTSAGVPYRKTTGGNPDPASNSSAA